MKKTICLALLAAMTAHAERIRFSAGRRLPPRKISVTGPNVGQQVRSPRASVAKRPEAHTGRSPVSQRESTPSPAHAMDPLCSFLGVKFGVPLYPVSNETGYIKLTPRYFMFKDALPMCASSGKVSGFRCQERCTISSLEQARKAILLIKADIEKRTGCPLSCINSHLRQTLFRYSGRYTDIELSVRISSSDGPAIFYLEVNNNRWVK